MIRKGDTVTFAGGPAMRVLAASDRWAICGWDDEGVDRVELFELEELLRQAAPQPAEAPAPGMPQPPAG